MADAGYRGDSHFKCPFPRPLTDKARKFNSQHKDFMSRHETINKRIKQFQCMRDWRHGDSEHKRCFAAVINITQLCIEEQPLFAVVICDSFPLITHDRYNQSYCFVPETSTEFQALNSSQSDWNMHPWRMFRDWKYKTWFTATSWAPPPLWELGYISVCYEFHVILD